MKFHAQIKVEDKKPARLAKAFSAELGNPRKDRSTLRIQQKKGQVLFSIDAVDAVALRAAADSLIKLLIVYEKMGEISGQSSTEE